MFGGSQGHAGEILSSNVTKTIEEPWNVNVRGLKSLWGAPDLTVSLDWLWSSADSRLLRSDRTKRTLWICSLDLDSCSSTELFRSFTPSSRRCSSCDTRHLLLQRSTPDRSVTQQQEDNTSSDANSDQLWAAMQWLCFSQFSVDGAGWLTRVQLDSIQQSHQHHTKQHYG